jgi:DNA-binding SARP family transcriptional activator/ABC-type branched-subunit amino acid transport system substrate-binding protein
MEFRLLGSLEVWDAGRDVPIAGAKRRALLSILLLRRNEVVSRDTLVDLLWGESPPPSAPHSLEVQVSKLRAALGPDAGRLQTQSPGYRLRVEPDELDVERLERLAQDGRRALVQGDPAHAADMLRDALALVHGPPLAEFAFEPFAQAPTARLTELQAVALEDRVDADLALGRHAALVGELEALVATEPLRERPRRQLMLALYRSGRQGDALAVYQEGRRSLVDALGVEPTRELRELERDMLLHAPALDAPEPPAATPPELPASRHERRGDGRWLVPALAGACAVAVGLLVAGDRFGARATPARLLAADTVGGLAPDSPRPLAAVRVPGGPDRLAVDGRTLWVVSDRSGTLAAIDLVRHRQAAIIAPGGTPRDVAAAGRVVWTLDERRHLLSQISSDYGEVVRRVTLASSGAPSYLPGTGPFDPWTVAVGAGAVWVTDGSRALTRIDRRARSTRIPLACRLDGVTVVHGGVWAICGSAATVLRVDPSGRAPPLRIRIVSRPGFESPYPIQIAAGLGSIWVLNGNTATVTRIDPQQRGIAATVPLAVDHAPLRLAVGDDAVWVAGADGTLTRIDPVTDATRSIRVARGLSDVAVAGGAVWVSAGRGYAVPVERYRPAAGAHAEPAIRALPAARCSPLYSRPGERPHLLVASDLPLQGDSSRDGLQMNAAIQLALRDRGFRAGRYPIAFQACDDGTPATVTSDPGRCAANARAYVSHASVVGVIGTFESSCAIDEVPILNRARGGPLAMVSPSNTYVGLTHAGPGAEPGDPTRYQPTGEPSYARVVAPDDVQAAADALLARQLGVRRTYAFSDSSPYGHGLAVAFARAAAREGITVVGSARWDRDHRLLVGRARAAHVDAVFLAGYPDTGGDDLLVGIRRRLHPAPRLLLSDGFWGTANVARLGPTAEGLMISFAGPPTSRPPARGSRAASAARSARAH